MNLETIIYLGDILQNIQAACVAASIFASGALGIYLFVVSIDGDNKDMELFRTIFKIAWKVILGLCLLAVFIPSENTIYNMAGVSMIKTASQSPEAQKTLKLINAGLDKALNKLEDSK